MRWSDDSAEKNVEHRKSGNVRWGTQEDINKEEEEEGTKLSSNGKGEDDVLRSVEVGEVREWENDHTVYQNAKRSTWEYSPPATINQ